MRFKLRFLCLPGFNRAAHPPAMLPQGTWKVHLPRVTLTQEGFSSLSTSLAAAWGPHLPGQGQTGGLTQHRPHGRQHCVGSKVWFLSCLSLLQVTLSSLGIVILGVCHICTPSPTVLSQTFVSMEKHQVSGN